VPFREGREFAGYEHHVAGSKAIPSTAISIFFVEDVYRIGERPGSRPLGA